MVSRKTRKAKSKTKRKVKRKTVRKTYIKKDYNSNDGMLTSVWGPPAWHFLHTISFNYPTKPTKQDKINYRKFISNLQYVLPCGHCRENFKKNIKALSLTMKDLKDRHHFSLWVYKLHEKVNKMLGKKSGLTFKDVRERYEHFRSRCTQEKKKTLKKHKKEKGCTRPLYGKKSKCVLKIIPYDTKTKSIHIDRRCIKKRS